MALASLGGGRERSRSPHGTGGGNYEEIMRLIVTREQARLGKDWSLADTIRSRLTEMGITLYDKTNSWRSSEGLGGRIPSWSDLESADSVEAFIATQAANPLTEAGGLPGMGGRSGDPDGMIKALVQQREQARSVKDFARSDEIRDELKSLGVEIYDREKMWRAKNGASGVIMGYHGPNGPTDLEISTLIMQREKARQINDFATGDMIRDELKAVGVEIFDKEKKWTTKDGRQGTVPGWTSGGAGGTAVTTSGGAGGANGLLPQLQTQLQSPRTTLVASNGGATAAAAALNPGNIAINVLQAQVVQAALAASTTPEGAVRTLQLLNLAAGAFNEPVVIHQAVTPAPATIPAPKSNKPPATAPGTAPPSAEATEAMNFMAESQSTGRQVQDAEIEWLVGIREKCRFKKDFSSSDELRNAMRNMLGIELFEKEKRWTIPDGRQGTIPMFNSVM